MGRTEVKEVCVKTLFKCFLIITTLIVGANYAIADTTQSRDGDGQKIQGPAYGSIQSVSLGTKGFYCFATTSKMAWLLKATVNNAAVAFKYFINGVESAVYPVTTDKPEFFQWQNAPKSQSPTVTSACMRAYSSASITTATGMFQ